MPQAKETSLPPPKRTAKTAQDAARFVDLATPGQEGVDPPGKVGSAKPAPQHSARRGLASGAPSHDHSSHTAQAPLHLRLQSLRDSPRRPSPSPQTRARGHPAPARTAFPFSLSVPSYPVMSSPEPPALASLLPGESAPPRPRHPRPFPRPGPRSLTPNPTSTSLEIATPTPGD